MWLYEFKTAASESFIMLYNGVIIILWYWLKTNCSSLGSTAGSLGGPTGTATHGLISYSDKYYTECSGSKKE